LFNLSFLLVKCVKEARAKATGCFRPWQCSDLSLNLELAVFVEQFAIQPDFAVILELMFTQSPGFTTCIVHQAINSFYEAGAVRLRTRFLTINRD
jgi:hypothetical protein